MNQDKRFKNLEDVWRESSGKHMRILLTNGFEVEGIVGDVCYDFFELTSATKLEHVIMVMYSSIALAEPATPIATFRKGGQ